MFNALVKEESVENVPKENQKSKKKKKKSANKQNSMQTNGQTHLVEDQTHNEEDKVKTALETEVVSKPGFFRKGSFFCTWHIFVKVLLLLLFLRKLYSLGICI